MEEPHRHETHPEIIKRLRRAEGHLKKVIGMIEDGRPCLDLAQQLYAVEQAIHNAKTTLIKDHLDHCLGAILLQMEPEHREKVEEFKEISRYL